MENGGLAVYFGENLAQILSLRQCNRQARRIRQISFYAPKPAPYRREKVSRRRLRRQMISRRQSRSCWLIHHK